MNKFTPEELVRYLYSETSDKKSAAIREALLTDYELKETLDKMINAQENLNSVAQFSPSERSVNKILEYAAKKSQLHSI